MIFDEIGISPTQEGDWFPWCESSVDIPTGTSAFEEPKDGAVEFLMSSPVPYWEERAKARKKESTFVLNPSTRRMEKVTSDVPLTPEQEREEADGMWKRCVGGSRKPVEGKVEIIPLSDEDKLTLSKVPKFQRWAKRVFDILSGEVAREKEEAVKNSSAG